ncbi:MAG TPA: pirin family protein [Myxococcus sp.]|nr:pirin family protein [Myxococcus sp.]
MSSTRRRFLFESGLLVAAAAAGCRSPSSPAVVSPSQRRVAQTLAGVPATDGAGVRLTRVIGQPALRNLDPFLMLDRFHSDDPGAYILGFPDHPHRGFETVTVMLDGRMRHRDSRGNSGLIQGGGAQWMTAGRGIIHSEMPEQVQGLMSGFQLWVNLPAKEKLCPAAYQDLPPAQLAEGRLTPAGSRVRVISGGVDGLSGPVRERPTQPLLLTAVLEDDKPFELTLPEEHTAFLFVSSGEVDAGPEDAAKAVKEGTLAVLGTGNRLRVRATNRRSELLIAAARPLREPIVQSGPFVMNTEAELRQAFEDYRAGVLDKG